MRPQIVFLDTVDSTNNYAMAATESGYAGHGYTVVARRQSAGRGQRGRAWYAGAGAESLLMSTVLKPELPLAAQWTFSMAVSVAIREAVSAACPGLDLRIKWPNDLIADDKKVGGILVENSIRGGDWTWAVVGIGINVSQPRFPPELPHATSLRMASGQCPRVEELARVVTDALVNISPATAHAAYERWLYKRGAEQSFWPRGGAAFSARVLGVASTGELEVETEAGRADLKHGEMEWIWPCPPVAQESTH